MSELVIAEGGLAEASCLPIQVKLASYRWWFEVYNSTLYVSETTAFQEAHSCCRKSDAAIAGQQLHPIL